MWNNITKRTGMMVLLIAMMPGMKDVRAEDLRIVATTGMIADIVRQVVGEATQVHNLIGEGLDPHQYRPTRQDIARLQQADMIFHNGLHLEGKMSDILARMAQRGKPVIAIAEAIQESSSFILKDEEKQLDPHIWMDVQGWIKAVEVVTETMITHYPDQEQELKKRAQQYTQQLETLDAYARDALASIPEDKRSLVTAHDAFNYLGRAYGITVRGIQGISTESEAGVRDIERLVSFLVENKIPAIFVETSVADKNVRALVEGARAQGHSVAIGGELFSDAMGQAGTYEGTYIGMMDHNITTITRALGGTAPAKGMQDKLNHAH
jgi:manganese/zinc/iron transport system substrate-binding protein